MPENVDPRTRIGGWWPPRRVEHDAEVVVLRPSSGTGRDPGRLSGRVDPVRRFLVAGYVVAMRRHRSPPVDPAAGVTTSDGTCPGAATDAGPGQFVLGIFFLWRRRTWLVGTLGASYLSLIHMLQYMLYTLAAKNRC